MKRHGRSFATASLVSGILGILTAPLFVGAVVALIAGEIARRRTSAPEGALVGRGRALAGLATGCLGIVLGAAFWLALPPVLSLLVGVAAMGERDREPAKDEGTSPAPTELHLRLSEDSAVIHELTLPAIVFGEMDDGDHTTVRVVGDDCDLFAIYGMDFPLGRGPVGRPGIIRAQSPDGSFPGTSADAEPWIRIDGKTLKVREGTIIVIGSSREYAWGRLEVKTAGDMNLSGDFALELAVHPRVNDAR